MGFLTFLRIQWDRATAVALVALGVLALVLGWRGASDTPHLAVQIPYFISGGLAGVLLLAGATALWLSADMRDEWRELRRLRVLLEETLEGSATSDRRGDAASVTESAALRTPRAHVETAAAVGASRRGNGR
jgi:hypothetical protein